MRRWAVVTGVILSLGVAGLPGGRALALTAVANWQMNEGSGATVMRDGSGNGIDGSIGSAVKTGVVVGGATAYRWPYTRPNEPPAKPERLVQVSDGRLNPGSRHYAITVRFRTTHSAGNMLQKGQSGTAGGYFKWQIPSGKLTCLFRGVVNGSFVSKAVNSGTTLLNDGKWHTVRCERTSTEVKMTIDGSIVRRARGWTGPISNTKPFVIGGKLNCNQDTVTCDYFSGDIDWVRIDAG